MDSILRRASVISAFCVLMMPSAMPVVAGKFDNLKEGGLAQIATDKKSSIAAPERVPNQVSVR